MQIGYGERSWEKIMSEQKSSRSLCPFILNPFNECYCASTNSMFTEATINYCGGNYKNCEIYQKHMQDKVDA